MSSSGLVSVGGDGGVAKLGSNVVDGVSNLLSDGRHDE